VERCERFAHTASLAPPPPPSATAPPAHIPSAFEAFHSAQPPAATTAAPAKKSSVGSHMTTTLFSALPISAESRRAIAEVMKYSNLSVVQEASMPTILKGTDVLVKAKTGTGSHKYRILPARFIKCFVEF